MKRLSPRCLFWLLWLIFFTAGAYILWFGSGQHLFAYPPPGTDQKSILECALGLARGELPAGEYRYSYAYTLFLSCLALLSGGRLWLMRLLQLAVAALIPGVVFRTARLLRCGRSAAFAAGLLVCFYAPLVLISLDFLRAAPLALAFALLAHSLAAFFFPRSAPPRKPCRIPLPIAAGVCAALCALGRENFLAVLPVPLLFLRRRDALRYLGALALPLAAVLCFNTLRYGSFQLVPGNAGNILDYYGGSGQGHFAALKNLVAAIPGHFADFCSSFELHNSLSVYAHREIIPFLRLLALPFPLLLTAGALGAILRRRERGFQAIALLALCYLGSMLFFTVFYRFRIPLVPLLAVLAAGVATPLKRALRRRRFLPVAAVAAAMAALNFMLTVDPEPRRLESEHAAVARLLIDNRRFGEAEEYLARMMERGEHAEPGVQLLLREMLRAGEFRQAEAVAERFRRRVERRTSGCSRAE